MNEQANEKLMHIHIHTHTYTHICTHTYIHTEIQHLRERETSGNTTVDATIHKRMNWTKLPSFPHGSIA